MSAPTPFSIILLLGSYDPHTRSILEEVKDNLGQAFAADTETQILAILLDDVELYTFSDPGNGRTLLALAETHQGGITLSVLDWNRVLDVQDYARSKDVDGVVRQYVSSRYGTKNYTRLALLEKFEELAKLSAAVFLVRDRQLTRGGEYIELVFLSERLSSHEKFYFFKKDGVEISEMAWEILDLNNINMRPYIDKDSLSKEAVRIVRNTQSHSAASPP